MATSDWSDPCSLETVHAKSLQSCLTLCDPMNCSLAGSSVHGILQARILEWVAMPFSRGSAWTRDRTHDSSISCIAGGFFTYMLRSVILLCSIWYLCLCTVICNMSLGNFISHVTQFPTSGDHNPMPLMSIFVCLYFYPSSLIVHGWG